jgi:hypothetical protein
MYIVFRSQSWILQKMASIILHSAVFHARKYKMLEVCTKSYTLNLPLMSHSATTLKSCQHTNTQFKNIGPERKQSNINYCRQFVIVTPQQIGLRQAAGRTLLIDPY